MVEKEINNSQGEAGAVIDEGLPSEDKLPPFLRNEMPKGLTNQVKWHLYRGETAERLKAMGYKPGTIRTAKSELKSAGYAIPEEQPPPPPSIEKPGTALSGYKIPRSPVYRETSPEDIIETIKLPGLKDELGQYEMGMKAGAGLVVIGVRIAQELSAIGIGQVKPLIDLTRTVREGEAAAAKSAAIEAAQEAAQMVGHDLAPYLDAMAKARASIPGANPMQEMMYRVMSNTMEPIMTSIMSKFIPGFVPQQAEASGWTRRKA